VNGEGVGMLVMVTKHMLEIWSCVNAMTTYIAHLHLQLHLNLQESTKMKQMLDDRFLVQLVQASGRNFPRNSNKLLPKIPLKGRKNHFVPDFTSVWSPTNEHNFVFSVYR